MPASARCSRQQGTALLTVLFLVVLLGLTASLAGQTLKALVQREREEELLWRGQQYMQALASYYRFNSSGQRLPASLEELLRDPRAPGVVRHLRRLYDDPMTSQPFEPIMDPASRVVGVRSTSALAPFRQDNFPDELESLKGKSHYAEWQFIFTPPKKTQGKAPAGTRTPPNQTRPVNPVNPAEDEG